jgi:hypothetical protein
MPKRPYSFLCIASPHNPKVPVMEVIVFVMDCPTSSPVLLRCPLNLKIY